MESIRREGFEEGYKRGLELGRQKAIEERMLLSLVEEGLLPLDIAVDESGLTEKEFKEELEKF